MTDSRKTYPSFYGMFVVLTDSVIYGNHFPRARLQIQLYDVCSYMYYFLQDFWDLYFILMCFASACGNLTFSHSDFFKHMVPDTAQDPSVTLL